MQTFQSRRLFFFTVVLALHAFGSKPLAIAYDYIALVDGSKWKLTIIKTFDGGSIYEFLETKFKRP
jgi:hypothetical protein